MATTLEYIDIYKEELPRIDLHYSSNTWLCEVMLQIKYFISPVAID